MHTALANQKTIEQYGFVCCSFVCGELWHDPVQCKVLKLWIKKCDDDSETSNWLAANTKANTPL